MTPQDITAPAVDQQRLVLPLRHDRDEFADWGWVRDQTGEIVYIAKTPCGADVDAHRRNKTDPAQTRVDALLQAFEIVQRLAEWSAKYPRQQVHSFSAKVDEQLIEIENAAKAWLDGQNVKYQAPADRRLPASASPARECVECGDILKPNYPNPICSQCERKQNTQNYDD